MHGQPHFNRGRSKIRLRMQKLSIFTSNVRNLAVPIWNRYSEGAPRQPFCTLASDIGHSCLAMSLGNDAQNWFPITGRARQQLRLLGSAIIGCNSGIAAYVLVDNHRPWLLVMAMCDCLVQSACAEIFALCVSCACVWWDRPHQEGYRKRW